MNAVHVTAHTKLGVFSGRIADLRMPDQEAGLAFMNEITRPARVVNFLALQSEHEGAPTVTVLTRDVLEGAVLTFRLEAV